MNALAEVLDREAGREDELERARANAATKSLPGPAGHRLGVVSSPPGVSLVAARARRRGGRSAPLRSRLRPAAAPRQDRPCRLGPRRALRGRTRARRACRSSRRSPASRWPGHMLEHVLIGDAAVALLLLAVRGPLLFFLLPPLAARSVARRAPLRRGGRAPRAAVGRARGLGVRLRGLARPGRLRLRRRARVGARRSSTLTFVAAGVLVWTQLVDPAGRRALSVDRRGSRSPARSSRSGRSSATCSCSHPQPLFPAYGDGAGGAAGSAARRARDDGRAAAHARRLRRAARALLGARRRGAGSRVDRCGKVRPWPCSRPHRRARASESRHEEPYGPLRRDVRLLGALLGQVLVEQEGEEFLATEEHVRAARAAVARGRRPGDRARGRPRARAGRPGEDAPRVRALLPARERRRAAPPHPPPPRGRARGPRHARVARGGVRAARRRARGRAAPPARRHLARARADRAPDRGDAAHAAPGARPHRRAADRARRRDADAARARGDRRPPGRGDHGDVADRRGARRAAARDRRDPPRALVLRGEPARRGRAALRGVPARASRARRRPSRSAPGSAATSTATRRSAAPTIAAALAALARARARALPAGDPRARGRDRVEPLARARVARARRVDRARRARAAAVRVARSGT